MIDPNAIWPLVDRYGLPLVVLVVAFWFFERLRQEERAARLKAEDRLATIIDTIAPALVDMKSLLGELEKEVIRGGRSRNHGP